MHRHERYNVKGQGKSSYGTDGDLLLRALVGSTRSDFIVAPHTDAPWIQEATNL